MKTIKYELRYFFDYGSGGCLWAKNDCAREKFGFGPIDADIYDVNGNIKISSKLKLSKEIKLKIEELDKLFYRSLSIDEPLGPSLWNQEEEMYFINESNRLYYEICLFLEDEFIIINEVSR